MTSTSRRQQILDAILKRAAVDPGFRQNLLTEPHQTIREVFGVVIPSTFTIRFVEKEPGVDALVVLPELGAPDDELSDDDLETVSGGGVSEDWFF
jgi:hypothetical protein